MIARLCLLLTLVIAQPAFAAEDKKACEGTVAGSAAAVPTAAKNSKSNFIIRESPRVPQDADKYKAYVKELTKPNGVLDQLGIEMTGQIVEFMQPRDLNAVTSGSAGGKPISHYLDGASVLNSLNPRGGFALEVVYPGPIYQHGLYRDDNKFEQQISIIDHVVGHNNFALLSGLEHYRVGQGLEATVELDGLMRNLYTHENKDEVQRFYLWAQTAKHLMDYYTPIYNAPEEFKPEYQTKDRKKERHPKFVTENVLQAFAANIDVHDAPWKGQILEYINTSMAFRPALIHTQIMNEGWASIMQEILMTHVTAHNNFNFWFKASQVMQNEGDRSKPDPYGLAENEVDIRDPYSLGVVCWRRIRERFEQQPDIKALKTQMEKDRAFFQYAANIIRTMTDETFLRFALDQTLVDRYKLAVVRKAKESEWDHSLPHPPWDGEPKTQWIIVTRDADKVAQMIIDKVLKPKYMYRPRVKLVDFSRPNSGEIELVLDDEVSRAIPLQRETLAPSLYALANIMERPVSLECGLLEEVANDDWIWHARPWWWPPPEPKYQVARVRVVVSPTGEVRVYRVTKERSIEHNIGFEKNMILEEKLDEELTKSQSFELKGYIDDLYMEDDEELQRVLDSNQSLRQFVNEISAKMIDSNPYDSMVAQAPNAAGAIMEYKTMVERRMAAAMARALAQKGGVHVGVRGARVKVLPSAVNLEFDMEYAQKLLDETQAQPMMHAVMNVNRTVRTDLLSQDVDVVPTEMVPSTQQSAPVPQKPPFNDHEGDNGQVGPIHGSPGDRFWGPDRRPGEDRGYKPGEDPNDLSWVDIPDELYSRFLNERVRLPILNPKPGMSRVKDTKRGARINRRRGVMLPNEISENALRRGIGALEAEGEDAMEEIDYAFEEGFNRLQPRDWVVQHEKPDKKPETKAVVTFVLDASGSTERYMDAFKRFVYDVEALVRAKYKGFDFRYIVFDTEAHVMKTRDEFFRARLGGGTMYNTGITRANKLMQDEYPRAQWDRYTFLLGDMEDWDPNLAMVEIRKLLDESEFFGTVAGLHGQWVPQLLEMIAAEAAQNRAVGHTTIDQDGGYRIDNIREVLRNDDPAE